MMQPDPVAVSCEDDEPNQLTIIFLANISGSFQKSKNPSAIFIKLHLTSTRVVSMKTIGREIDSVGNFIAESTVYFSLLILPSFLNLKSKFSKNNSFP